MAIRTVGRRVIVVTLGAAATPISATNLFTTDFEVYFPAANGTAVAYIGSSAVANTWIPRLKEVRYNFVSGTGSLGGTIPEIGFNLATLFILGGNGDKAIVEYMAYDRA